RPRYPEMVLALAGDSTMTSRGRLVFFVGWDTLLLGRRCQDGLAGWPALGRHAGHRLSDELAQPSEAAPADDAVRRAFPPRPHERTGYACRGQRTTDRRPGLLVGRPEPERVAGALPGRVATPGRERPPAQPGTVQ